MGKQDPDAAVAAATMLRLEGDGASDERVCEFRTLNDMNSKQLPASHTLLLGVLVKFDVVLFVTIVFKDGYETVNGTAKSHDEENRCRS